MTERISDRIAPMVEAWGLSLAYAVTGVVEEAEKAVSEAVASVVAAGLASNALGRAPSNASSGIPSAIPPCINVEELGAAIFQASLARAFNGHSTDSFFRLAPLARAASVLRAQARLSLRQIARILGVRVGEIDGLLETARITFSGRAFAAGGCATWSNAQVFGAYLGGDLRNEQSQKLFEHLVGCDGCRESLAEFKQLYSQWVNWPPRVVFTDEYQKQLDGVVKAIARAQSRKGPSLLEALRRSVTDGGTLLVVAIALIALGIYLLTR